MWIQTQDSNLQVLVSEHTLGERVEFSENGTAQVQQGVGESMIDHYDTISEYDNE